MKLFNNHKNYDQIEFNHFWKFSKKPLNCGYEEALDTLSNFSDIVLPHDWLIYQVDDLYETSSGWYYKKFVLNKANGCKYFIRFDGIYMNSTIYLNNKEVGEWKNGYTSFEFDITDLCQDGENIMVVKVLHEHPNSRWYSGAGIYRNVYLVKKQENHLKTNGIYIHTDARIGEINIQTKMNLLKDIVLEHNILKGDQLIDSIKVSESRCLNQVNMKIEDKINWSPDNPFLYKLITNLYCDNKKVDSITSYFGFKDVQMDPNLGLILNGEKTKLNGVCEHHDLGAFGAAFSKPTLKKRLKNLKAMGVNAIRCAHSVPAKELMELADEMGFLIVSEAFDMWELPKNEFDYARFFHKWVEKDVESWIKRDRNHVSLLMWSIGNEIYDTHVSPKGIEIVKMLRDLILQYDPLENGKVTISSNFLIGENTQKAADELKVVGYNYLEHIYDEHHQRYPDWIIFGSETSSIVQSRGIYHFPLNEQIYYHEDKQCSSLGNSLTSWGSKSLEASITVDRDIKYSLGQFIWSGHDYLGESTPYDTKNAYMGQIDTAGFPKDVFYVRQASWLKNGNPVLHVFPYWNFNEGQLIDVRVATNAKKVELYLNNKLIGSKYLNIEVDQDIIPTWQVPFEKGELKAIAHNENDEVIAEVIKKTFSNPVDFKITVSNLVLKADGDDVSEIIIETLDGEGNLVEDDNQVIEVIVTGAGKLLGLDNGDSTDFTPYKGQIKPLFSGKLKAFVGSMYQAGTIYVTIKSSQITAKVIEIKTKEVPLSIEQEFAKNSNYNIRSSQILNAFPQNKLTTLVRSIKLSTKNHLINKENNHLFVRAEAEPFNNKLNEIIWSIVTKKGIPTDNAIIKNCDNGVILEGVKDGEFVLRAAVKNHKKQAAVISELNFAVSDITPAYKDPFSLIRAGLFDQSFGEIKAGNEFGIATSSNDRTSVIYHNIDFGNHRSEKITLSIFSFESNPLWIEMYYKEIGSHDFRYLDRVIYHKETIWNVYQEQSYLLPEEIGKIVDLKFVFERAVHFKGFYFNRISHSNQIISIKDANTYYGDHYLIKDWGFSEIGNNTTFIFNELFFDEEVDEITIEGKARANDNSIRIQLTNINGNRETYQVEFRQVDVFSQQTFKVKPIKGSYQVEIIFLPGSSFDFKTFKFT